MSEQSWYYLVGDQQQGPVDTGALEALIRSGEVPRGALVWRDGMAGWQPWDAVPELAARVASAFPPSPGAPASAAGVQPVPVGYAAATGMKYPKAPLLARLGAAIIDGFLFLVPGGVLLAITIALSPSGGGDPVPAIAVGVMLGLVVIAMIVYAFIKDGLRGGQSLGKRVTKLMVVHLPTNQPCTKGLSAIRYLVMWALSLIPYVGWLVEPIVVLADGDGRRLGDRAANAQVIALSDYRSTETLRSVFS